MKNFVEKKGDSFCKTASWQYLVCLLYTKGSQIVHGGSHLAALRLKTFEWSVRENISTDDLMFGFFLICVFIGG